MHNNTLLSIVISACIVAALAPRQASAEVNALDSARRIYTAVGRRHWVLAECVRVDPARKVKYDEALRSYDRANSTLLQKVRAILVADARKSHLGISEQAVLSTFDRWLNSDQNKINHDIQSGDPEQFRQQCDYIANPEGRARYHVTKQWDLMLVGLPADQYPAEAKVILAWGTKEQQ
jgi:hypothetical protein